MALDLNRCFFLDFEARSEADITEVGARAYAEHPTTEALCCAWTVGLEDAVELWIPGYQFPPWVDPEDPAWINYTMVAQNKDTERFMLQYKMGIKIPPEQWVDLATWASAAGMPRNLHDIGDALHLDVRKQAKTTMLALAKPRKLTKKNREKWWTTEEKPELYQQLYDYCKGDVDVMRRACAALPPYEEVLPAKEQRLAVLNDRMNDRGVDVDLKAVDLADAAVERHGAELRTRFAELYPGVNPRHPPSVSKALGMENSRKETVRDMLKWSSRHDGEDRRTEALTLLKTIKTASTAKLRAFRRHACRDGRVHGAMVFHGAGRTGRWSSMGVQLHNLFRGLGVSTPDWPAVDTSDDAMEKFFDALHGGILDLIYPDPTRAVAAAMKGFIWDFYVGLISGDFSQIEARCLVTWAGQTNMVEAFRRKLDPYKIMAAVIYNTTVELVNKDQRYMGKQAVLGAGYGVGPDGFIALLKVKDDVDVSFEEAQRIVYAYREANPRVKELWYAVERLALKVIRERVDHFIQSSEVPLIAMKLLGDWMVMRLPSGRCLWYHEPEVTYEPAVEEHWEVDFTGHKELIKAKKARWRIFYWGRDPKRGGMWTRVATYGGKLVENATQAMARDVMADAMLRLDHAGFRIQMQVHDEIIAPGPASDMPRFEAIMREPPRWWRDLPIDVEVQHNRRYQK